MNIVDVHAHLLLPGLQAAVKARDPQGFAAAGALEARRNGEASIAASGAMIGERIDRLTNVASRLESMNSQGVDSQVVSPSPSHYYPWAGPELAVWAAEEANRQVAAHIALAPGRLLGLGLVPLQHPDLVVAALEHAMITCGLAGIELSSFGGDVELSDPRLEPFWTRAEQLGAVILLHPFGCSLDERLDRYYLSNTVGQPVENAVAISHLIFSGVLDRHPRLKIIAAHGGGYLPTYIGRSDRAWRVRPEAHGCAEPPSSYLGRLWYDTVVHDASAVRALVAAVGAQRVVLGSDFPFDMGLDDPVAEIEAAGLDAPIVRAILADNARALFDLGEVSG